MRAFGQTQRMGTPLPMKEARVLVVDDSAAMRALFCDILEQSRNVEVIGTARNADDARDQIEELKPNIITLDVEMPGMSGIDFLQEIMEENPLPVVMLSSITQSGTGTAQRALDLGAVACFPKPVNTSQENFKAAVAELGKIVLDAVNGELKSGGEVAGGGADEAAAGYEWDGKVLALSGGNTSLGPLRQILAALPANCPPTLITLDCDEGDAQDFMTKLSSSVACTLAKASNGAVMEQGTVYIAYDSDYHAMIEAGPPPVLRLVDRDPVGGVRPSADLLFGALTRAGIDCVGGLLEGPGTDGAKGLAMLRDAGKETLLQQATVAGNGERIDAARRASAGTHYLGVEELAAKALELTSKAAGADQLAA